MTSAADEATAARTKGHVMRRSAWYYDLMVGVLTLGRERAFRERLLELARVQPGEAVLDVGCGTGTLAIAAKRRAGASAEVRGIDASPEMIARARRKAARTGLDVGFDVAIAESLPFPERRFDVVLSTMMLHHLPREARDRFAREVRRVLEPSGRILAVDFATPRGERHGVVSHLHRHRQLSQEKIAELLENAGLTVAESGPVGFRALHFTVAVVR